MLIGDQVLCDCCGNDMGKLMAQPAPQSDLLPDLGLPPYFVTCPDCFESEPVAEGASNKQAADFLEAGA